MKEALDRGFKQIDLDLINESEKGNAKQVYQLMLKGANSYINPIDISDESCFENIIGSDWQYHSMLTKKIIGEKDSFDSKNCYGIIESLFQAGVSNYILDIVSNLNNR